MQTRRVVHTGYWPQIIERGNAEFLEDEYEGTEFSAYEFLHGCCTTFAYLLAKTYGYQIITVRDFENCLVHAYCRHVVDGIPYYIDIRGITTEEHEVLQEFDEGFGKGEYLDGFYFFQDYGKNDLDEFYGRFLRYSSSKIDMDNAKKFLSANRDFYIFVEETENV